jgi:hypothetical protein
VFFPSPYDYGDFIPGWESFHTTFTRLRHILAIVVEISLVIYIKLQQDDSQSQIFSLLVIAFLTITFLSPTDAVGGKGKRTEFLMFINLLNAGHDRVHLLDEEWRLQSINGSFSYGL